MKPKTYNVRPAMLAMAMAMLDGEKSPNVRKALADHTDIPADRLDFAASEIGQTMFGLKQVVMFMKVIADTPEGAKRMVEDTIGEAGWIDDDKRNLNVNVYAEKHDQGEEPLFSVATKLKAVNDEA